MQQAVLHKLLVRPHKTIFSALAEQMEPNRVTEQRLLPVQEELKGLEPIFHHPELGTTREVYEAMTETDFWEVGASGRRYSRESIVQTDVPLFVIQIS